MRRADLLDPDVTIEQIDRQLHIWKMEDELGEDRSPCLLSLDLHVDEGVLKKRRHQLRNVRDVWRIVRMGWLFVPHWSAVGVMYAWAAAAHGWGSHATWIASGTAVAAVVLTVCGGFATIGWLLSVFEWRSLARG
jgi:hypothetical protein